jgi:hypothetical protein
MVSKLDFGVDQVHYIIDFPFFKFKIPLGLTHQSPTFSLLVGPHMSIQFSASAFLPPQSCVSGPFLPPRPTHQLPPSNPLARPIIDVHALLMPLPFNHCHDSTYSTPHVGPRSFRTRPPPHHPISYHLSTALRVISSTAIATEWSSWCLLTLMLIRPDPDQKLVHTNLLPLSYHTSSPGTLRANRNPSFLHPSGNTAASAILNDFPPPMSQVLASSTLRGSTTSCTSKTPSHTLLSAALLGPPPPLLSVRQLVGQCSEAWRPRKWGPSRLLRACSWWIRTSLNPVGTSPSQC